MPASGTENRSPALDKSLFFSTCMNSSCMVPSASPLGVFSFITQPPAHLQHINKPHVLKRHPSAAATIPSCHKAGTFSPHQQPRPPFPPVSPAFRARFASTRGEDAAAGIFHAETTQKSTYSGQFIEPQVELTCVKFLGVSQVVGSSRMRGGRGGCVSRFKCR